MLTNEAYVAAETVRQWAVTMPLLLAGRAGVLWSEARGRRSGQLGLNTLIVGAGLVGQRTAQRLLDEPRLGLIPVGFLDDDPLAASDRTAELPVYGLGRFDEVVETLAVEQVIIAFSHADHDQLLRLAHRCWELGLSVSIVPRLFEIEGERGTLEYLGGLPLVNLNPSDPLGWQFGAKYALRPRSGWRSAHPADAPLGCGGARDVVEPRSGRFSTGSSASAGTVMSSRC